MRALITAEAGPAITAVLIEVELGLQELLSLVSLSIELYPLLVDRVRDAVLGDTSFLQPGANSCHAFCGWCEQVMDLIHTIVSTIVL